MDKEEWAEGAQWVLGMPSETDSLKLVSSKRNIEPSSQQEVLEDQQSPVAQQWKKLVNR